MVDFATQFPEQSLREAVEVRLEEAQGAVIDYGLHVMVTDLPPGREGELADLLEAHQDYPDFIHPCGSPGSHLLVI